MTTRAWRVVCAMFFPLTLLLGTPPATADTPLDAAAIHAKVKAAAGPFAEALPRNR